MKLPSLRTVLVHTLMVVMLAAPVYVSAQQAMLAVQSLAGKWVGAMVSDAGSTPTPVQIDVKPDGSYSSTIGSKIGQGTIKQEGGKLIATGHLITGPGAASGGDARSELTVGTKDGKQTISGAGRDNYGPFNFVLTKQQ